MRKAIILSLFTFLCLQSQAQLLSPAAFLGYEPGSRYTPHWKILDYLNHVARNSDGRVSLQEYGSTNEGRPLMVAFVSSKEHIANLENIRKNNLRLAGQLTDRAAPDENAPAIVWLSYNVHGNEPSSSEAAMLALYAFADPSDAGTSGWLKNTVVVIDPCLNPDGRERYTNWFTSVAGKNYDPSPDAREHEEPWPGGRSNHYNFDLNRDWAWQTQVESRQRLTLYNQWLPQVHVDYHEQSVNDPYYFAPAAEPYHEVITPWQRDFQMAVGKKHAAYFDANGWLYFTREVFDLYYPSYGDTYPIYNGAIGMTYEQAGGPQGGLGALTDDEDTLTLTDRIRHHFTTSMSTVEVASANAPNLVKEFRKYFSDAVQHGAGEYKSYVIKRQPDRTEQVNALLELLAKNNIQYSNGVKASGKGYNYDSGREEAFAINKEDIVISTFQPRASLVKVLFEPKSKLVDSLTYDITAWALPYIYGVAAYASREKIATGNYAGNAFIPNVPDTAAYGYVIKWESIKAAKVLASLLAQKIKVRFTEEPFETGGVSFERGSLIVVKTSNQPYSMDLWKKLAAVCNSNSVTMYPVKTGFVDKGNDFGSGKVRAVKPVHVGLLTGEQVSSTSAGEVWHFFDQEINYPVTLINTSSFGSVKWGDINVLIMPEGDYSFLKESAAVTRLKAWITAGGKLVVMGSAAKEIAGMDWGLELKKKDDDKKDNDDPKHDPYESLKRYSGRDRDMLKNTTPGSIYKVDLDNTHPLAFGYPDYYYTLKMDDNIYEYFSKEGWNVGTIRKANQVAGFVGMKLKERLKDGLLYGVLEIGKGEVVILADDPLFRSFWENGKLLFANAVFFVGD